MQFYHLALGSGLSLDQNAIIQALSQAGGETIQTSDGLFTAIEVDESALRSLIENSKGAKPSSSIKISRVEAREESEPLTPDMKNLIKKFTAPSTK